jgi:hypothetical protein
MHALCTECKIHRAVKQTVCSLCRQRAQRTAGTGAKRSRNDASTPWPVREKRVCIDCASVVPQRGDRCSLCARIADDAALKRAGYTVLDWHHVRDNDEGHTMLRSTALARIAGRAA